MIVQLSKQRSTTNVPASIPGPQYIAYTQYIEPHQTLGQLTSEF